MNKKISINLTATQYQEVSKLSEESGLTITDWVISKLPITQENSVTLEMVKEKIDTLNVMEEFSLPSLFKDEWKDGFSKRSKLSMGRLFFNKVESGEINTVKFIGKTSANLAKYKKIK